MERPTAGKAVISLIIAQSVTLGATGIAPPDTTSASPREGTLTSAGPGDENAALPQRDDEEFLHPPNPQAASEIAALTTALTSPVYSERKSATEELIEIGVRALPQLRKAYRKTNDLEAHLRIEEIVETTFLDYHVFNRHGFLGVSLTPYNPDLHPRPEVPEGMNGAFLSEIESGKAAEQAGLLKEDVIVAIDGQPFRGVGQGLSNAVAAMVRAHRPGTTMSVTVIRGNERLEIDVILGRCSPEQLRNRTVRVIGFPDLERNARSNFPGWWARNFRDVRESSPGKTED